MRNRFLRSSLYLAVGFCFSGLLVLSACGTGNSPEPMPTLETRENQPQELMPTGVPANTQPVIPTVSEEGFSNPESEQQRDESTIESGYPAPGNEVPTLEEQVSGYPAPEDPAPNSEGQVGGYPAPEEESPPPLKTQLEATDPHTVSLASGELQLVEFFAFW